MKFASTLTLCLAFAVFATAIDAASARGGNPGGVTVAAGFKANVQKKVGEKVCFTLTARDENGNVLRSWDQIGAPVTITLHNSQANTDSSTQSWNADPEGYTWAVITHNDVELTKISPNEWSISNTVFVDGVAQICMVHTRADTGVYLEITPTQTFLNQVSDPIDFVADDVTNYLVELYPATQAGDQVYLMRRYEIIVSPRDRYMNVNAAQTMRTRFTARFPGEFDQNQPGLSDIFSGEVFVTGVTNYFLASRIARIAPTEMQWVRAYASLDASINGQTAPYEVLDHAPAPFALITPPNHAVLPLTRSADLFTFTWDRPNPPDPYTNIQVSRFDATTFSDNVTYTWVMVDSVSLTNAQRIASDNGGAQPQLTLSHGQIWGLVNTIAGGVKPIDYSVCWFVEATDGLYTTVSSPAPGHYLHINAAIISAADKPAMPTALSLGQNYPNPFNPSTSISFSTTHRGAVLLRVFDVIGTEIATLVNRPLDAGAHTVSFNASRLPSGVYVYRLEAEGATISKRMVLMK